MYTGIITPMRLSFFSQQELDNVDFFFVFEIMIDICFGIDIIINFITGYERSDGEIEYRWKKIVINYLTGFFWIDFLSTFPFHLLVETIEEGTSAFKANNFLKLARL